MANIKKHSAKKAIKKRMASRGNAKVIETFDCGCCRPVVTVDGCGCVETQFLC